MRIIRERGTRTVKFLQVRMQTLVSDKTAAKSPSDIFIAPDRRADPAYVIVIL
jgi:hypothetical protein